MKNRPINIQEQRIIILVSILIIILSIILLILHRAADIKIILSSGITAVITLFISYKELNYKHKSTVRSWNHQLKHLKNEHNNNYEYKLRIRLEKIQSELLDVFLILDGVQNNIYTYPKYGMTPYLKHIQLNNESYFIIKISKAIRLLHHINFKIEWALEIATFLCYRKKYNGSYNKKELIKYLKKSKNQSWLLITNLEHLIKGKSNQLAHLKKIKSKIYSKKKGTIIKNIRNARYASQYLDIK